MGMKDRINGIWVLVLLFTFVYMWGERGFITALVITFVFGFFFAAFRWIR